MNTLNNNTDFTELDDLRQQINDLREKVDRQGHLNEALVKKALQGKMKRMHTSIFWYCLACFVFLPFMVWDFISNGFSWPFIIFTIIMFLGSFVAEYFINRMDVSHMTDDLLETARKLTQMKADRKKQLAIGYSVLMVWAPWYIYETYRYMSPQIEAQFAPTVLTFLIIGAVIGAAIGIFIGMSFYRKMQHANDEMINQINDLTRE